MTDKPIRVLRVMEYIYPDWDTMADDMTRWQVQGTYRPRNGVVIRSTTFPPEIWDEPEQPIAAAAGRPMTDAEVGEALGYQTPETWAVRHRVYIEAADGWRDSCPLGGKDFDEPLPESEFLERLAFCTQGPRLR